MGNPVKPYQKKDGTTYYMLKLYLGIDKSTGKQVHITKRGFKTIEAAEEHLVELRAELEAKNAAVSCEKSDIPTYMELYKSWVSEYEKTVEESTFVKTTRLFDRHIIPYLGNHNIKLINTAVCQKFVDDCSLKLKKFKTVKVYAAKVLDLAVKEGYIENNPFSSVIYPEVKPDTDEKISYYSEEELIHFLSCVEDYGNTQMTAFFRLLSFTGVHKGEALALKWSDLDFSQQRLCVSMALTRGKGNKLYTKPTRSGSGRQFTLDDETCRILALWKKEQREKFPNASDDEQLMFSNEQNGFLQQTVPRKWLMRIIEQYKLPHTDIQSFRNAHCFLLLKSGMKISDVQQRLGRIDIETTYEIQSHVSKQKTLYA